MVAAQLHEPLVDCMGHDVVVVGARSESVIQERLELECAAHPAQLKIAQEELTVSETGIDASLLQI